MTDFPNTELENPNLETSERILGVDPSLACTGYAVIERTTRGPVLKEGGVVRSGAEKTLAQRICEIAVGLRKVMEQYQPKAVAVEQGYAMPDNPQTTIKMAHVRGAILLQAHGELE